MTEEYKKEILNYMIGKLGNKEQKNEPLIRQVTEISNNLDSFIKEFYPDLSTRWNISILLSRGDYILCFIDDFIKSGTYFGRWKKTFIVVLNKNYNPVRYIDSYNSGTMFGQFMNLNSDDTGTGNIYITDTIYNDNKTVNRRRLLIINDFTLTNFEVRLLSSFEIPKYNNNIIAIKQLIKNPNTGRYLMLYTVNNTGGALEFVNNVGSENEWNFYPYKGTKNINWSGYLKGQASWNDDKLNFKIFCDYAISNSSNNNSIAFVVLQNQVSNETKETIDYKNLSLPIECKNVGQIVNMLFEGNKALIETTTTLSTLDSTKYIIEYDIDNSSYSIRYKKEDYIDNTIDKNSFEVSFDSFNLFSINGQLYFIRNYVYYKNTHNEDFSISNNEYFNNDLYLYQIFEDEVYEFYIKDLEQEDNINYKLSVSNTYNLYEFGLIFHKYIINIKEVFNVFNYNGLPNRNEDCLVPNSVELYSNDDLVFARNIHNITINSNMTISSVEIPNNYINDIDITNKKLISKTNLDLINNNDTFRKNIYEKLYLNFINFLQIIDRNNNNNKFNSEASSFLNNAVNTPYNYDKTKLYNKAILYYQNGSSREIRYEYQNKQEYSLNIALVINVDDYLDKLELVSNDKEITYQTIDLSNLKIGKYYNINQKLEVI